MNHNTKIDFIYLSEQDMIRAGVTDMLGCVNTMEEMFGLLYHGDYRMAGPNNDSHGAMVIFPENSPFPNMPKPTADRRMMAMPAYLGGNFCTAGVKWYGSNIANREKGLPRSILMFTLNDPDTGAPLAHMSANLLSAYRTGAIPGVGARHLARKDSRVIGLLGPGVMGKTTVAAFMAVCPNIDTLKIKGRGAHNLNNFVEWVRQTYPQITTVTVVDSIEAVVRDSDLVTFCNSCATGDVSQYPMIERAWVKPGAFLAMPAATNMDEGMEQDDVRKVVDNTGLYQAWHEELPKPGHQHVPLLGVRFLDMIDEGKLRLEQIEDLGKIIAGEAPARTNDEEIIVLSVGGMPVEDVAWGTVIYRNAVAQNIGVKLNLWDVPALS
ncbi:tyramine oxidase subunit B [Pseudomonas cremoricolorata]|uniref:Ornithine cyclodeaminase n=1 Tax=Pseudomonas cremoricolorata TaxID=157783 RepID=A0A089WU38_9PSED|nr:tyramine oxidase subunit B [Pseudomonas cremoricolorata]AIR90699.1 ornithine cyclodeaminase [Pseudomonas cremoricolorata]